MSLCECGCGSPAPIASRSRPDRGQERGQPVRFVRGHAMRGKTASVETRQKMSAAHQGQGHTEEARARMSAIAKHGAVHPKWKGDAVAYSTLHRWLGRVAVKTGRCSRCGIVARTDWANLSGEYRRDIADYAEMCRPCHKRFDLSERPAA